MTSSSNPFKLGIFVIVAFMALIATAAGLGARAVHADKIECHTYFDESVQGLEVGAPVKLRGVLVGVVSAIRLAPDGRHVDVVAELELELMRDAGLATFDPRLERIVPTIPLDLRAQLASQGITGVKYLLLDYFDIVKHPPPELPFQAATSYIPAAGSLFKSLEDTILATVDNLPDVSKRMLAITSRIDALIERLDRDGVPGNVSRASNDLAVALADLRVLVATANKQKLPAQAAVTLSNIDVAVNKIGKAMDQINGKDGLIARARNASDVVSNVGSTADGTARTVDDSAKSIGEAAESIRDLVEALERDPDMLLKGRSEIER